MRSYIDELLERGDVRVVEREVDPRFELAAVVSRSQQESDAAVLFRNVRGSALPVISNVYGSHRRMCELIGTTKGGFCRRWVELSAGDPPGPEDYERVTDTPGDLVEGRIGDLPHITYFERDAGPYLTAGVFLARDPDTGVANLSFSRSMMVSDEELRVRLAPPHDLTRYQAKAEARDEPLEVAILLGPPPELFLAACASLPYDADEMAVAAQIRGGPIDTRPGHTVALNVPVDTDVVVEGRILPNVRKPEGPFGEFQGYYVPEAPNHVFEVTHVSWREGAYLHALAAGSPEDLRALELSIATRIYRHLTEALPGVLDVSCNPAPQQTVIQIRPQYEGHARQVLLRAFGSHMQYNKICIVVDEDVDIHDFDDVWWAVVTRCRVDQRVMRIEDVPGFFRDEGRVHWGRMGIDATRPWGLEDKYERKRIPGAAELDLKDYLGKG